MFQPKNRIDFTRRLTVVFVVGFIWPQASNQGTKVFKLFARDWAMRIRCLAQGHYCRVGIRTRDLHLQYRSPLVICSAMTAPTVKGWFNVVIWIRVPFHRWKHCILNVPSFYRFLWNLSLWKRGQLPSHGELHIQIQLRVFCRLFRHIV